MSSSWGDFRTPCPSCGGIVQYWYFGGDCRGNDADSGIACRSCKRSFSSEEWNEVAATEMAERSHEYWKRQYDAFGPYKYSPYHPDYDFSRVLPLSED